MVCCFLFNLPRDYWAHWLVFVPTGNPHSTNSFTDGCGFPGCLVFVSLAVIINYVVPGEALWDHKMKGLVAVQSLPFDYYSTQCILGGRKWAWDHSAVNFVKSRIRANQRNGPGTDNQVACEVGVWACVCMGGCVHTRMCMRRIRLSGEQYSLCCSCGLYKC